MAPIWPNLSREHPLRVLHDRLPEIIEAAGGYSEVWRVTLLPPTLKPEATPPIAASGSPAVEEAKPVKEGIVEPLKPTEPVGPAPDVPKTEEAKTEKPEDVTRSISHSSATTHSSNSTEKADDMIRDFQTLVILQKFLRANANKIDKAADQLKETLIWRSKWIKEGGELSKGWNSKRFAELGFVSVINDGVQNIQDRKVVTWNIYGIASSDIKRIFGDLDQFLRWRVALMEFALDKLNLETAEHVIPDYNCGPDPYLMIQVHDYADVSLLRLPSEVRAASKKVTELFQAYYPETLKVKYFLNVPTLMSWMFSFMKKFLAMQTMAKLEAVADGRNLVSYFSPGEESRIVTRYGGSLEKELRECSETVESPVLIESDSEKEPMPAEKGKENVKAGTEGAPEAGMGALSLESVAEEPAKEKKEKGPEVVGKVDPTPAPAPSAATTGTAEAPKDPKVPEEAAKN